MSTYLKVRDAFPPQSALLESSDYHANENSISYLALKPIARVEVNRGICRFLFPDDREEERQLSEDFTISDALNSFIGHFEVTGSESGHCGLFGFTTFNCVKYTDNIAVRESIEERNDAPPTCSISYINM